MANKNICPKCGKGQIICTYLGEPDSPGYHLWNHDCTNPACASHQAFGAREEHLDIPGFPAGSSGIPITTPSGDGYVEELGPGKAGGCPGHE